MPDTIAELGVTEAHFDELAAAAEKDPTAIANPVRLDAVGFREIFEKAYRGDLS